MNSKKGFTIVEVIVVVAVICLITVLAVLNIGNIQSRVRDASRSTKITIIAESLEKYFSKNGEYPGCTAMSQTPQTVTTNTLAGMNADALTSPSDASGTNSILESCADLTVGTDKFAYIGDGSATCLTGAYCTKYTLKYYKEEANEVIIIDSRHTSSIALQQPPAAATGGTASDQGRSIARTSDGGYVITGTTSSYGTGGDVIIIKYNNDGSQSWAKTWGGTGNDQGLCIIQTSDNGYVITGSTTSFGTGGDMFIAKFDADGNNSWSKTWGYSSNERANSIIQTSDGGYAITGFATTVSPEYGSGADDVLMMKFTSTGTISWRKTWGDTGYNYGSNIIQTNDGGFAIIGRTISAALDHYNALIIKLDSSGSLSWNKTWTSTGTYDDGYDDIIQTSDSGFLITGLVGSTRMLIQKFTSTGTLSWSKTWGSATGNAEGMSIIQTNDSNIAVTGSIYRIGTSINDIFLAKFDTSGNLIWNMNWGGTGADVGYGLIQNSSNNFIIVGSTASYGAGGNDIALLKFSELGQMSNCSSPMCETTSSVMTTPTGTLSTPSITLVIPSYGTLGSPTATVSNILTTSTIVLSP